MEPESKDIAQAPKAPDVAEPAEVEAVINPPLTAFPVVGIGASAGGLAAFEEFFRGMPANASPGMAFVLVQHLAPDHKSLLAEIVQRFTRMKVLEVTDGVIVQQDCVYIIPPSRDMALVNGALQLHEPGAPRGLRLPIDFFFQSLAEDQREHAIGVILSGTGSDGTHGVRAINSRGGLVVTQRPESAEYDGMPTSAIATGLVDLQLRPAEMPTTIMEYVAQAFRKAPIDESFLDPAPTAPAERIFSLLRIRTGHDFSGYKQNTIQRRIERRMAVHQIATVEDYVKFLEQMMSEVDALFNDLLIGVTSFFRDPEAFQALDRDILSRVQWDKPAGGAFRVWAPGCSTGEEAYSIGILIQERLEEKKISCAVQIFATDIDTRAIAIARTGTYPPNIVDHVSSERLARFFTMDPSGESIRINKVVRDMLVFSEHDIIKDPAFSRLDLIVCRNLLIYMSGGLQKRLIPLFHYALDPGGTLFLGTSETVGEFTQLFGPVNPHAKIYQRREDPSEAQRRPGGRFLPQFAQRGAESSKAIRRKAVKLPLRELTEQALLLQVAPAGALVNDKGDILYLYGRTGIYLEPSPGEVGTNNILKMARDGLRRELRTALHKAVGTKEVVRVRSLRIGTKEHFVLADLTVRSVNAGATDSPESPLYIVILEEAHDTSTPVRRQEGALVADTNPPVDVDARIEALKHELQAKEEYLQTTHDQLGASNEELMSSNEEMQSVNEEMQSTNEELETSKEELQSVNEELATVNSELQTKVTDLSRANNDMNNLLAGTGIATLFVDLQLRILRFTPAATVITNLIPTDVGRPLGHIASNLIGYDQLVVDAQAVVDTLTAREVEVQARSGKWYTMRIQPYRTLDNVIEGVVITFVEITEIVRAREALRKADDLLRLSVVVRDASDAIIMQDLEGRILAWNPSAVRIFGWSEAEALSINIREMIPKGERDEALVKIHQLSRSELLEPYRAQRITKSGSVVKISMTSTALVDKMGTMYAIVTTERLSEARPARGAEGADGPEG